MVHLTGGINGVLNGSIGKGIEGQMILEVPVQKGPIPQEILDLAILEKIKIRDILGHVYN
jgi:hypothetical protein